MLIAIKMKQILGLTFLAVACGTIAYFDEWSPRAIRCRDHGGHYDVLPGGYGECAKVTVTQISLN